MRTPALLAILDGVGIATPCATNALSSAQAPFLHELFSDTTYPCRCLIAAGRDVGLPEGQMGNSEVGHLNIGAGRVVHQELTRIDLAMEDRSLFNNELLCAGFEAARAQGTTVHFMGLLSDGGVHSHVSHLYVLAIMAAKAGVTRIRLHAFLDGRDVAPTIGRHFISGTEKFCEQLNTEYPGLDARIGSISGRYYAMDRDKRWERVERAWKVLVTEPADQPQQDREQAAPKASPCRAEQPRSGNLAALVQASYDAGITDEFFEPVCLDARGIQDGDTVVFFNFRPDRARELTRAFLDPAFDGFERPFVPKVTYLCMTEYDPAFEAELGAGVVFAKSFPANVLADYLASLGLRQLHIAETEKYAHVTFFLNGGVEAPKPGEQRVLIPSPKVATYDLKPEMSAPAVAAALVEAINNDAADVYIVNFANGDMVGHTGVLPAAIKAIEAVDNNLKRVIDALLAKGGVALVTADHGNAEKMTDEAGNAFTAHTTAPVPLALIAAHADQRPVDLEREQPARLADIAPTLLDLMELPIPSEWTGRSLLVRG
ncbi:MAG: 2,3-bisphosphoglycerate-independent phosphoglycerate mutase [Coriobacteriales bacterium]|jgi:2,3-bisphosphoglycerate-independent phosphoglycerate mutase|nr:2,3-bisphosphoglycerate-independent phosphoglycerate mutase [Coriobacteriales bacterium]